MRRRLFHFIVSVSLLLCVATAVLWVRSYFVTDAIVSRVRGPQPPLGRAMWLELRSHRGILTVRTLEHQPSDARDSWVTRGFHGDDGPRPVWRTVSSQMENSPSPTSFWQRLGFRQWLDGEFTISSIIDLNRVFTWQNWEFPHWIVMVTLSPPFGFWIVSQRLRRNRRRRGLCTNCGYDLRGTPTRCPECGLEAAPILVPSPGTPGEG